MNESETTDHPFTLEAIGQDCVDSAIYYDAEGYRWEAIISRALAGVLALAVFVLHDEVERRTRPPATQIRPARGPGR